MQSLKSMDDFSSIKFMIIFKEGRQSLEVSVSTSINMLKAVKTGYEKFSIHQLKRKGWQS